MDPLFPDDDELLPGEVMLDEQGLPVDPMADPMPPPMPNLGLPVQIGPILPSWYVKPKKPKAAVVKEEAEEEEEDHRLRLRIAAEMLSRLNLEVVGYFERYREEIENGEMEAFVSTALRDEHDAACAWISGMALAFEAKYKESIDKEEATAKEDFLHYWWEWWQESHSKSGNSSLRWAMPDILQKYGMLVAHMAVDPDNDEIGLTTRLVDPATVFPIFEGDRGLSVVYRIYNATASDVIGLFGTADGKVERKVKKIATDQNGRYDRLYEAELIEYWDRNWAMVIWEDEVVRVWEHGYAHVPFVVKYGCFGMQNFTRTPDESLYAILPGNRPGEEGLARDRTTDLARKAQPFLYRRTRVHDMEEAIAGLYVTALRRSINPPVVHKQSMLSAEQGDIEIDRSEGGTTTVGETDDIQPLPNLPQPEIIGPLMELIAQNRQTGMAPGLVMGQNPAAQTSGTALDILAQGGFEKWSPLVLIIEEFVTELGRMALELIRDWGELLGPDGERGGITVPRRTPNPRTGEAPAHYLTPDMLRMTGTRVVAKLKKFNPSALPQLMAGFGQAAAIGIMDKRTMIDLAGFTDDPDGVFARLDEEKLDDVPELMLVRTLDMLTQQAERAMQRGDQVSAYERLIKAQYVASQAQMAQMTQMGMLSGLMGGGGAPPGMGPGGPGMMPPGLPPGDMPMGPAGPMPPPPGVPLPPAPAPMPNGSSQTMLGGEVGTEGGRPPGAPPDPMMGM